MGQGLGLGLADFTDDLARDPVRRRLMAKVTVGPDPRCDEIHPTQFPAVLTVTITDGRVLERFVPANRGGPANPLSDAELARKFDDNVSGLVDAAVAERVRSACLGLADLPAGATPITDLRVQ